MDLRLSVDNNLQRPPGGARWVLHRPRAQGDVRRLHQELEGEETSPCARRDLGDRESRARSVTRNGLRLRLSEMNTFAGEIEGTFSTRLVFLQQTPLHDAGHPQEVRAS